MLSGTLRIFSTLLSGLFCIVFLQAQAQESKTISGHIYQKQDNTPLVYANVYNLNTGKGCISNEQGYFSLAINSLSDSIRISYLGFQNHYIKLQSSQQHYRIVMKENIQLLSELEIFASDQDYLVHLLSACRDKSLPLPVQAQAYYELKSHVGEQQIELIEGFYNSTVAGYDLIAPQLKAGRLALLPYNDRMFISIESSLAITRSGFFHYGVSLPVNPLNLNKRKMQKAFRFKLVQKYTNDVQDSIFVIRFVPHEQDGNYFEGKIWINISKMNLLKVDLLCSQSKQHPFLPLFKSDRISNVAISITKTFKEHKNRMLFEHIDFAYSFDYHSRVNEEHSKKYKVFTQAVFHVIAYDKLFTLPYFNSADTELSDYRQINAFPFNDFFWDHCEAQRPLDNHQQNESFFNRTDVYSNQGKQYVFEGQEFARNGMFESPYTHWSEKRITIRNLPDTTNHGRQHSSFVSDNYKIDVKLYADINTLADSTHILTATILDPYESFYYIEKDSTTNCFINLCFDLGEIHRRALQKALEDHKSGDHQAIYTEHNILFNKEKTRFLHDVKRGTDIKKLRKWNDYIAEELGIDNMALFGLK